MTQELRTNFIERFYIDLTSIAGDYFERLADEQDRDKEYQAYHNRDIKDLPGNVWREIEGWLSGLGDDDRTLHYYSLCHIMSLITD